MYSGTTKATAHFPDGYIRNGVWVSGDQHKADMTLVSNLRERLTAPPMVLQLPGRSGWLTAAVKKGAGGPGTFGFTMTADQLYNAFYPLFKRSLGCDSPTGTVHGLVSGFKSDVDVQGSNAWAPNPKLSCDSVSWGLDVEWAPRYRARGLAAPRGRRVDAALRRTGARAVGRRIARHNCLR